MRAVWVVLGLVVSGLGMVLGVAGPAAACSCASVGLARYVEGADVVVTGILEDVEESGDGLFSSGPGRAEYHVTVESTYKGRATEELVFTSSGDGASCGVEGLDVTRRYTFFLSRSGDGLTSSLCSGNRASAASVDRRVAALTGEPTAPLPSSAQDAAGADRDWWLPATGAVLTGLAAAVVLVRRRRTRP